MSDQTCVTFLFGETQKEDTLKNIGIQTTLDPVDFHWME